MDLAPEPLSRSWDFLKRLCFCYRNGRWRSVWTIQLESGQAEVSGLLKVQVHYYEDGNIQLVSSKEIKEGVTFSVSGQFSLFLWTSSVRGKWVWLAGI